MTKDKIKYYQLKSVVKEYDHVRFGNKTAKYLCQQELSFFIKNIRKYKLKKILDAPCGTGRLLQQIAALNLKIQLYGIDASAKMLTVCQNKVSDCHLEKSNLQNTNFQNNTFDGIINLMIYHHYSLTQVKKMLNECIRILKPGGLLMFDTHNTSPKIIINLLTPNSIHRVYLHSDKTIMMLAKQMNLKLIKNKKMFIFPPRVLKFIPLNMVKYLEKISQKLPKSMLSRTYWIFKKC